MKLEYASPTPPGRPPSAESVEPRFPGPVSLVILLNVLAAVAVMVPAVPSLGTRDAGLFMLAGGLLTLTAVFGCLSRTPPRVGWGLVVLLGALGVELWVTWNVRRQIAGIEAEIGVPLSSLSAKEVAARGYVWVEYGYDALRVAVVLAAALSLYLVARIVAGLIARPE